MAEVDPRFDPVFQRGYDPSKHGAKRARQAEPVRPEPAAPGPVAPEPVAPEPAAPEPAAPESALAAAPVAQIDGDGMPPSEDATLDDPPPRRIRYRLVLLLASLASLLAAGALVWLRVTADPLEAYYGSNPGILFRLQVVDALITPLLVAGLTGLVLWLALGALRRRDDA